MRDHIKTLIAALSSTARRRRAVPRRRRPRHARSTYVPVAHDTTRPLFAH